MSDDFVGGFILGILLASAIIGGFYWLYNKGKELERREGLKDDPSGNDNIKPRKPGDYM